MKTNDAEAAPRLAEDPQLLAHCPRCAYSVVGLPVEYRCPECGLALNRRWRVFGGRAVPTKKLQHIWTLRILFMAVIIIGTVGPLIAVIAFLQRGMIPWPALYLALPMILIVFLLRKTRKFFALADDGLYIYHGRDHLEFIAWERIGKVIDEPGGKSLTIPIDGERRRIYTGAFFGVDVFATNAVARAINQHPRIAVVPDPAN